MDAVRDLPERESKAIIFEEHSSVKGMYGSSGMVNNLKDCKRSVSGCLDNVKSPEESECDAIDCAAGICIFDGMVKLLACIGILS